MYTEYQSHLHDQSRQAGRQLAQAERKIDQQRRTLIALSVDRKVIEQYKERCKTAFECEQELKDQKNLDELAALARDRRKRLHEENE
jgi:flagellar export protein FliJ